MKVDLVFVCPVEDGKTRPTPVCHLVEDVLSHRGTRRSGCKILLLDRDGWGLPLVTPLEVIKYSKLCYTNYYYG